jgi:hypothetical protein
LVPRAFVGGCALAVDDTGACGDASASADCDEVFQARIALPDEGFSCREVEVPDTSTAGNDQDLDVFGGIGVCVSGIDAEPEGTIFAVEFRKGRLDHDWIEGVGEKVEV